VYLAVTHRTSRCVPCTSRSPTGRQEFAERALPLKACTNKTCYRTVGRGRPGI